MAQLCGLTHAFGEQSHKIGRWNELYCVNGEEIFREKKTITIVRKGVIIYYRLGIGRN